MSGINAELELREAAGKIVSGLTQLGYCYQAQDGHTQTVRVRSLTLDSSRRYGLVELDASRLPRKVSADRLCAPSTLHHLSAVVGRRVRLLNTTGITFCLDFRPRQGRLPRRVALDLSERPGGRYVIPLGVGRDGALWASLEDTGHVLLGGATGSGKTSWINAALVSLLDAHGPGELRLAVIDAKELDFTWLTGLPHLVMDIASEPDTAAEVTGWLLMEIEARKAMYHVVGATDLRSYNRRAEEPLPLILAVVDEFVDLAVLGGVNCPFYKDLLRLATKARAYGIRLLLSATHPKAEVLNTTIRENCHLRLAFRTETPHHAKAILGVAGPRLPQAIPGRAAVRMGTDRRILQGFYPGKGLMEAVVGKWGGSGPGPLLSEVERALAEYALRELGGDFKIKALATAFKGSISQRQLEKLARRWEHRGLLLSQESVTAPRRVSASLEALMSR